MAPATDPTLASVPRSRRRSAAPSVLALVALLARSLLVPVAASAADSHLGDNAAAWPASWTIYTMADGTVISDTDGDVGCGTGYCDIGSVGGTAPSIYVASNGTTVFFRLRTVGDPANPAAGGFLSTAYVVQVAVGGVLKAAVGLNGKTAADDYVYVTDSGGAVVDTIYSYPFDTSLGQNSAATRVTADGLGQYFVDFQVPLARITARSDGGAVTASAPVQLFFGTSQAANLSVINKDFMTGAAVSFAGLKTLVLGDPTFTTSKSAALVSGPNPPSVGSTTTYDLTLGATSSGLNGLTGAVATDTLPAGVTIVSASTSKGSISAAGQDLTWTLGSMASGITYTATVRVSVTPVNGDWGAPLSLNPGFSISGTDSNTGATVNGTSNAVQTGAVVGNRIPDAVADSATTTDGAPVAITVLANDSDPDGPLPGSGVSVTVAAAKGITSVNPATGVITYTPNGGTTGTDTFTYQACDGGAPDRCDTALVTVTILRTPVAVDDTATVAKDGSGVIDVLANDTDLDAGIDPASVTVTGAPAHGGTSVNPATGAVTYTPDPGYEGADALTYRVCDADGLCDTAVVSLTVEVNDPPVAGDDSASPAEDGSAVIDVLANDTDPDDGLDPSSVTVTAGPAHGGTSVNPATGAVTYTPDPDYFGPDAFTYEVCDQGGLCDTADVAVTVTPVNDGPTAVDDAASVTEDGSVVVDVLANDGDIDDGLDPASVTVTSGPAHGTTSVNPATGAVTYTPDADYTGPDAFTYRVCDVTGACASADVALTVDAVNDPPVALDDTATTAEDAGTIVDVLANDTDPDDGLDPSSVTVTAGPAHGATSVNPATGEVTYTPDADYAGADAFTYEVCDLAGLCVSAEVAVTVVSVNDAPVAAADVATVAEDGSTVVDVLANDTDPDDGLDPASVVVTAGPSHGSTSVNPATGEITYTPDPDSSGPDSFTYQVCDLGGLCDVATVSVTVTPVNDAPVALDDSVAVAEDGSVAVDVLANDADIDDGLDPASVTVTAGPAHGTTSVNPATGEVTYTPDANYAGPDAFTYEVCDLAGACATADVSVDVGGVNDAPVPADDSATVAEDGSVVIDVLANDSDPDDGLDPSSVIVTAGPAHGSVGINPATGEITYTPDPDYAGPDAFTYQVCDLGGLCVTASVDVTVDPVNDGPSALDDSGTVAEDGSVVIDVLANDSDIDDGLDPSSVAPTVTPVHGSLSVNPATGEITYTPDPDYAGPDAFTYEVCDLAGACTTADVAITVVEVNDAPVATDDVVLLSEGGSVDVDVLANDTDVDDGIDPTSVVIVSAPLHGSVSVDPGTGVVSYTADPGWSGADAFTYQVCDLAGLCDVGAVTLSVSPVNDGPSAGADDATVAEDGSTVVDVLANDSDPDDGLDPSSVTVTAGPSHGSLAINPATGAITYTPDPDYAGADAFTYEVCDLGGLCDTASVAVTVTPVNDGPSAGADSATVAEDGSTVVDVLANDSDPDDGLDPASVTVTAGPAHGSVAVNPASGAVTYTPDPDYAGPDTFTYRVCDLGGLCVSASVTITVTEVNDVPSAGDDSAATTQGGAVTVDLLANDGDPDGSLDPASVRVTSGPDHGTVSIDPATGEATYTPDPGAWGDDTFTYEVCDDGDPAACATASVSVHVNAAPVTRSDAIGVEAGKPVVIDVLGNDGDPDGSLDPSSVAITVPPSHGTVVVDPATGVITYVPDDGFSGTDGFTYRVCDTGVPAACSEAAVSVVVGAPPTSAGNPRPPALSIPAVVPGAVVLSGVVATLLLVLAVWRRPRRSRTA